MSSSHAKNAEKFPFPRLVFLEVPISIFSMGKRNDAFPSSTSLQLVEQREKQNRRAMEGVGIPI